LARRRGARRSAQATLQSARASPDRADVVAGALLTYVADRTNLPTGGLTRADAVARLRKDGVADDVIGEVDDVLAACEAIRYAGQQTAGDELIERASQCLQRLERTWKP
jgi:hypothetical protein